MKRSDSTVVVSAFTEEQVERLTSIAVSRLRYWDRTDFFKPSFAASNRRSSYSRIYSFTDIASLRVIASLMNQFNVPLQHLRHVISKLGKMDNAAWVRTTLYVMNRKVIFDDAESGRQQEIVSGQYMIGIELENVLSDTRRDVASLSKRDSEKVGEIVKARNIAHNALVISGTRVPIRSIQEFADAGYSVEKILLEYPTLTATDIKAAIRHSKAA
jgi:uncharacterized protein (DUF433 family)